VLLEGKRGDGWSVGRKGRVEIALLQFWSLGFGGGCLREGLTMLEGQLLQSQNMGAVFVFDDGSIWFLVALLSFASASKHTDPVERIMNIPSGEARACSAICGTRRFQPGHKIRNKF
jgi:hypothetical protein